LVPLSFPFLSVTYRSVPYFFFLFVIPLFDPPSSHGNWDCHIFDTWPSKNHSAGNISFPFLAKSQLPFPLVNVNVNVANVIVTYFSFHFVAASGRTMQRSMPVAVGN
ncbi:hypothetical protein M5D96_006211, partial [Drosophila gunungcola]